MFKTNIYIIMNGVATYRLHVDWKWNHIYLIKVDLSANIILLLHLWQLKEFYWKGKQNHSQAATLALAAAQQQLCETEKFMKSQLSSYIENIFYSIHNSFYKHVPPSLFYNSCRFWMKGN